MGPKFDIMHVLRLGFFFEWVNLMDHNHIACNYTSKCATYDLNYHIINSTSKCAIHDSIENSVVIGVPLAYI